MERGGWRQMVSSLWHRPVASLRRSSIHLYRWFQTPVGKQMLAQELELIELCRQEYKGELMMQMSGCSRMLLGRPSRKCQKVVVSSHSPRKFDHGLKGYSWLVSELDQIPLEDGAVDFLVLHHVLEFSENPHAVLREAARVLAPQGQLIVICFNPYSLFGLRKSLQLTWRREVPWAHHGLSCRRLLDWLHFTSCEPMNVAGGFYGFPLQSARIVNWMAPLDRWLTRWGGWCGGFYVIHASKDVMTPIDRKANKRRSRRVEFSAAASAVRAGARRNQ